MHGDSLFDLTSWLGQMGVVTVLASHLSPDRIDWHFACVRARIAGEWRTGATVRGIHQLRRRIDVSGFAI